MSTCHGGGNPLDSAVKTYATFELAHKYMVDHNKLLDDAAKQHGSLRHGATPTGRLADCTARRCEDLAALVHGLLLHGVSRIRRALMHARAKLFGHPIHQMLIVFPLGLLATSLVFDIVYEATGNVRWADISYVMIASGIIGGLLAAIFGLVDWLAIPGGTRAKRIGALHGLGNVAVVALFAISWLLRYGNAGVPGAGAFVLSIAGVALALVTGWLGGELVDRLAVGVHDGANVNAPSSLSGRPAHDIAPGPSYVVR